MNLEEISKHIDEFIQEQGGYWDIPWLLSAITEEVGELSRALQIFSKIRKTAPREPKNDKNLIEEEVGDILFALTCLTNFLKIDLEIAVLKTLNKYRNR
ncbi:MAG: hypothetical protein EAX86_07335 [Candidatus Heimdallarchaeota archaeon]|nr:hypothetical protein [Candidatus Heimdallarchaeota archaeon]